MGYPPQDESQIEINCAELIMKKFWADDAQLLRRTDLKKRTSNKPLIIIK